MGPKKAKASKASLKKTGTMASTAAAGQEFLKQAWGEDKLKRVNALLDARDKTDKSVDTDAAATSSTSPVDTATASSSESTKAKPKLSKARTMKNTTTEAEALIGSEALGDTRSETKRRLAAVKAKKTLEQVTKSTSTRKPALKRLGTMANTAREGKAYIKRIAASNKKGKTASGRKSASGRAKNVTK